MYDPQKAARKRLGWLMEDTWKPYDVDEVRVFFFFFFITLRPRVE